jgi:hypothetical protein
MKHTIMRSALLFSFLFMLLASVSCGSNKSLEIEKEKIQYKEKVQKTLDRLERKLTTMRAESEESDTTTVENELATDDSLSQFETMEDQLNQKLGEMENVADSDWNNLKAQIDQLLAEYEQKIDESIE